MNDWKTKALELDREDPLASFRERFIHPPQTIYLDGNSLGKLPLGVAQDLEVTIQKQWGQNLVRSWNDNWFGLSERISKKIVRSSKGISSRIDRWRINIGAVVSDSASFGSHQVFSFTIGDRFT